jgi:hypothetical protein
MKEVSEFSFCRSCFPFFSYFVGGLGGEWRRGGSFCGSSSSLSFLPCFSTLPSALPFLLRYASLAASSSGFFFLSFYLRHLPPTGRPRLPRPRVRLALSILAMHYVRTGISDILHLIYPGCRRASILFGSFFSSRGRGGSWESEMWGSRLRSRRLCRLSTILSFFLGLFFFWRGILISGCIWRYTQRLALAHALSWFTWISFSTFWRLRFLFAFFI